MSGRQAGGGSGGSHGGLALALPDVLYTDARTFHDNSCGRRRQTGRHCEALHRASAWRARDQGSDGGTLRGRRCSSRFISSSATWGRIAAVTDDIMVDGMQRHSRARGKWSGSRIQEEEKEEERDR